MQAAICSLSPWSGKRTSSRCLHCPYHALGAEMPCAGCQQVQQLLKGAVLNWCGAVLPSFCTLPSLCLPPVFPDVFCYHCGDLFIPSSGLLSELIKSCLQEEMSWCSRCSIIRDLSLKAQNDLIVASEHMVKIPVPSQTGPDSVGLVLMQLERIYFFFPLKSLVR